jgi:hypothetical protein
VDERTKRWLIRLGELGAALMLSLVAASAMTWPAVLHMDEVIVGGGELGGWLWRYGWHFMEVDALIQSQELGVVERVLTFFSLGRHPETGNILDVLFISYPLAKLSALPAHYNLKVFIILLGNGVLGYALARSLTWSRSVALLAALVAVINPVSIQDIHGSGLRQVLLWFVLLFPIVLERAERLRTVWAGALAGVVLGLCGAWYWFYGLFAGMFLGLYCIDLVWRQRRTLSRLRTHLPWLGALVAMGLLVGGLFALPYVLGESGGSSAGQQKLPELSFFLKFPSYDVIRDVPLRPSTYEENVLSSLNRTIMSSWSADYLFSPAHPRGLPVVVFFAGLLPAIALKPGLFPRSRFWAAVFVVFWLGTLGPFLKWGGDMDSSTVVMLGGGEYVVRMPWTLMFRWVPGMSRMFAPYRMGSLVVVGAVALVAMGLSRVEKPWLRRGLVVLGMIATFAQTLYRWEVGPVPDDAIAPTMWRPPIKVSALTVPDWYQELEPDARAGLVELPLEQQQDLLYYYQLQHGWKVYRSWATKPAIPTVFRDSGGGEPGDKMRFLARTDMGGTVEDVFLELSRNPDSVALEQLSLDALQETLVVGNYRYIVVHERGYYLLDSQRGSLLYNDVVRGLSQTLQIEPIEVVELAWFDYPGNEYKVPDGPVYVPWSSQEVNLPDREMPNQYFMAVFDVSELVDSWEGPAPEALLQEQAESTGGHEHIEAAPGAPHPGQGGAQPEASPDPSLETPPEPDVAPAP